MFQNRVSLTTFCTSESVFHHVFNSLLVAHGFSTKSFARRYAVSKKSTSINTQVEDYRCKPSDYRTAFSSQKLNKNHTKKINHQHHEKASTQTSRHNPSKSELLPLSLTGTNCTAVTKRITCTPVSGGSYFRSSET